MNELMYSNIIDELEKDDNRSKGWIMKALYQKTVYSSNVILVV